MMSRESEWLEFVLHDDFPNDVEFLEGSAENHVIVKWEIVGADDTFRETLINEPVVRITDEAGCNFQIDVGI
ncbi:hypothetical protein [Burkholderia cenocepacia]|uniref:hypothetical protein n=1 Tax=Burkholderia cenocepacia TaxID=95486 RepID=UPI001177469A|nr:hypothetical protein [Burkholderia cenocepacia]